MLHRKHYLTVRDTSTGTALRAEVCRFGALYVVKPRWCGDMSARTCKSVVLSCAVLTLMRKVLDPGLD
jgi:hypothetical protein